MIPDPGNLKKLVQEKYTEALQQTKEQNAASCCGSACGCSGSDLSIMAEDYSHLDGYVAEADYALGCGIPTEAAQIREGDTVLDLGSGAGNDVFVARRIVGVSGRVIGLDMTEAMLAKARENNRKLGYTNVAFLSGDIEQMPLTEASVDVIVSNCVLNLVPDKVKAFGEMYRVLRPGGHFAVSDIVTIGTIPDRLVSVAELYAGCVSGAIPRHRYLGLLAEAGFISVTVAKQKQIALPESIVNDLLTTEEREGLADGRFGLLSITVSGTKPPGPLDVVIRQADGTDLAAIQSLLRRNDLPADDIAAHLTNYLTAVIGGRVVGVIGLERYDADGFLRSFAVEGWLRGAGIGSRLFDSLMAQSAAQRIHRMALLTTTAERFFAQRGFQQVERDAVPEFVRTTTEFQTYCSSSAVCMLKQLP